MKLLSSKLVETVPDCQLYYGNCVQILQQLPDQCADCVITDPPYPYIKRPYGTWDEDSWMAMMRVVVPECMRCLTPTGSAVFVLQPNSEKLGRMRTWLWKFLAWVGEEFGIVQDAYWWNFARSPTVHCNRKHGLMRPSIKMVVWIGLADCYRNQENVLWESSLANIASRSSKRALEYQPSGGSMRRNRCASVSEERGGVTPFNLLPIPNSDSSRSAGAYGHGAGTPLALCSWWTRYICPPKGTVLDPFAGTATTAVAALKLKRRWIGIERMPSYVQMAKERILTTAKELEA